MKCKFEILFYDKVIKLCNIFDLLEAEKLMGMLPEAGESNREGEMGKGW